MGAGRSKLRRQQMIQDMGEGQKTPGQRANVPLFQRFLGHVPKYDVEVDLPPQCDMLLRSFKVSLQLFKDFLLGLELFISLVLLKAPHTHLPGAEPAGRCRERLSLEAYTFFRSTRKHALRLDNSSSRGSDGTAPPPAYPAVPPWA